MKFIKLTNLKDSKPVFINPDFIGHMFEVDEGSTYGSIDTPKHTRVGVTTHNNGGFQVLETVYEIIKLINVSG
jgi:ribosomal protein S19